MSEVTSDTHKLDQTNTQERQDLSGLLANIDLAGLTAENSNDQLQTTLSIITESFGADHGYIMLCDNEGTLQDTAASNRTQTNDSTPTASSSLIETVVKETTGLVINDAMNNNRFAGDPDFQRFNIGCAMCVPVKTSSSQPGALYLDSTDSDRWNNEHLQTLEFLAGYIAMAIGKLNSHDLSEGDRRLIAAGQATLNLSHSVKNILQMISGAAEVVDFGLRTNQIHRVKRSWDILKPNLERMRKYTLELLDYSKERKLNIDDCDFNRVIQGAIESLKSQLKQKNSKINIRIDQKMPTVQLDSERIHEMALNIILNAIDIVDDTGGLVSVETKYHADEQQVSLAVTDNGPGISDEMKERIFTPFESEKKGFGTGLGMPIAKQIIDQHRGTIEIESLPSRGTSFTICLPANVIENRKE